MDLKSSSARFLASTWTPRGHHRTGLQTASLRASLDAEANSQLAEDLLMSRHHRGRWSSVRWQWQPRWPKRGAARTARPVEPPADTFGHQTTRPVHPGPCDGAHAHAHTHHATPLVASPRSAVTHQIAASRRSIRSSDTPQCFWQPLRSFRPRPGCAVNFRG